MFRLHSDKCDEEVGAAGVTAAQTVGSEPAAEEAQQETLLGGEPTKKEEQSSDAKEADDKGSVEEKAEVPESYADFVLPEGVEMDKELLAAATPLFKEAGMSQEVAQKFIDFHAEQVQAGARKQLEAYQNVVEEWRSSSLADKEFGGDKLEETTALARSAIQKLGTPELGEMLESTGTGNHPEMIRFMARVGALTREDVPGKASASMAKPDRAERLYPSS